jgi:hypothetical protein
MIAQHQLQKGFGKLAIVGTLSVMAIGLTAETSLAIPLRPLLRRAVEGILGIPSNPQNLPENQQQFPQGSAGASETFPGNAAPQYSGQPNVLPQYPGQPNQQPTYQQPTYPLKVMLVSLVVSNNVLCVKQAQTPAPESNQVENTVKSGF